MSEEAIPDAGAATEAAEGLGLLLGSLSARQFEKQSFGIDELTLLATCHSPASACAALAAELDIFCEEWRFTHRQLQRNQSRDTAESLRRTMWFTALNSARFKYRDYLSDRVDHAFRNYSEGTR